MAVSSFKFLKYASLEVDWNAICLFQCRSDQRSGNFSTLVAANSPAATKSLEWRAYVQCFFIIREIEGIRNGLTIRGPCTFGMAD